MSDETLSYDIIIVGAGPSGLATAIHLKQLARESDQELSICILEKGAKVGAHILSGAVIEPAALSELIPKWSESPPPFTKVTKDRLLFLTKKYSIPLLLAKELNNNGNIIVSLGEVCTWLANIAENLDIDILEGFSAKELIYANDTAIGIVTTDMGVSKTGDKLDNFQPGMKIFAKQTVLAEGCRGHIATSVIKKFKLNDNSSAQTYGLGIKELWEVPNENHRLGEVTHTLGWPLNNKAYGGGFIYHMHNNLISIGLITGLDYSNTYLDPFKEMQLFKTHPSISKILHNGTRINFGAKAISEGGLQSIPKLTFKGGLIVGDAAGFVNIPKIKGTHNAIRSGMLAAKILFKSIHDLPIELDGYETAIKKSSIWQELKKARNIRPAFKYGLFPGMLYSALDLFILRWNAPWTITHKIDRTSLKYANKIQKIKYPKPNQILTFDKSSSLYLSGTMHRDDDESHLKLKNYNTYIDINIKKYDSPETRYCPADVYEIVYNNNKVKLQVNAQNCLHCKTCDIKDPTGNITWTTPEGGEGPNYMNM